MFPIQKRLLDVLGHDRRFLERFHWFLSLMHTVKFLLASFVGITRQYRDWQETRLKIQISDMKRYVEKNPDRNLSFTVHVGDIQKIAHTNCSESAYIKTASLLREG